MSCGQCGRKGFRESEAHRLGALFVDRWTLPDPVALVRHVLATWGAEPVNPPDGPPLTPPALTRWAEVVARAVASSDEPKTVASWARIAGRSSVSLRALCALAGVSPRNSCTLARVLRAVYLARRSGRMEVAEWLDVGDDRTLNHLLAAAGLRRGGTVSIEEVLLGQQLVPHEAAMALLSRALRRQGVL